MANTWDEMTLEPLTQFYFYCNVEGERSNAFFQVLSLLIIMISVHKKFFTSSDSSVGLADLFKTTELFKFRERKITSHAYLIIVTDAAHAVSVNFFGQCKFYTDLTQKIGIFDRFYAKSGVFYRFNAKNWRFSV